MLIGILKETLPGERRVALVPSQVAMLAKQKHSVVVEQGAGEAAGYRDADYESAGARLVSRAEALAAEIVGAVRGISIGDEDNAGDLQHLRSGSLVVGTFDPLAQPQHAQRLAPTGVILQSLELLPRTTRAQSMDVLSSMANLAGYKAVLMAANALPRIMPMMTTAAGTLTASKVLVLGAGVAGLQAIATAKRLGAAVEGYDIRPEVAEQVKSVGGKFVDLGLTAGRIVGP